MDQEVRDQIERLEQKIDDLRTQCFCLEEMLDRLLSTEFQVTLTRNE